MKKNAFNLLFSLEASKSNPIKGPCKRIGVMTKKN